MSQYPQQEQIDDFTKIIFFNKYRPIKLIGEGKFAKIYSAVNLINQQKIALKVVNKYYINNLIKYIGKQRCQTTFFRTRSFYYGLS